MSLEIRLSKLRPNLPVGNYLIVFKAVVSVKIMVDAKGMIGNIIANFDHHLQLPKVYFRYIDFC